MPSLTLSRRELDLRRLWALLRERAGRRQLKLWAAYLLYGLALASLLLYLYFPTAKLKERLEAEFEARLPGRLSIDRVRVVFGPALRLEGVAVRDGTGPAGQTYLEAERVILKPTWRTLLGGAPDIAYEMNLGEGSVAGRLSAGGEGKLTTLSADFKDVVLKRGMLVKQLFGFEVSGKMGGHAEAELGEKLSGSRGKLTLEVTGGKLSGIDHDAIPLETVKFKHLNLECDLAAGKIVVRRADIKDGEMTNKLSGLVVLADSVMESRLDLRGNLAFSDYVVQTNELEDELPDKGKKGLPYIVSGTLRAPKFALDLGGPKAAGACEEDEDLAAEEDVNGDANGDEEGPSVSGPRGVRRAPASAVPPAARYRYPSGPAAPRPPVAAAGRE